MGQPAAAGSHLRKEELCQLPREASGALPAPCSQHYPGGISLRDGSRLGQLLQKQQIVHHADSCANAHPFRWPTCPQLASLPHLHNLQLSLKAPNLRIAVLRSNICFWQRKKDNDINEIGEMVFSFLPREVAIEEGMDILFGISYFLVYWVLEVEASVGIFCSTLLLFLPLPLKQKWNIVHLKT